MRAAMAKRAATANAVAVDFGITPVEPATSTAIIGPSICPKDALNV